MDEHSVGSLTESSTAETACKHHWLIEPPNGPTSTGVCKLCGTTKKFDNQMPTRPAATVPQTSAQKEPQSSDDQVLTASQ